jgi:hypothetical protein
MSKLAYVINPSKEHLLEDDFIELRVVDKNKKK